ncbi:hypothetical protein VTK26DRAFT_6230 [Humicola hyalothermophila]
MTNTTVTTLAEFGDAVSGSELGVVTVEGAISGYSRVNIGSRKSILGAPGSSFTGVALHINQNRNVLLRNLKIYDVPEISGDAIASKTRGTSGSITATCPLAATAPPRNSAPRR